jgi:hypothetical protein
MPSTVNAVASWVDRAILKGCGCRDKEEERKIKMNKKKVYMRSSKK